MEQDTKTLGFTGENFRKKKKKEKQSLVLVSLSHAHSMAEGVP